MWRGERRKEQQLWGKSPEDSSKKNLLKCGDECYSRLQQGVCHPVGLLGRD